MTALLEEIRIAIESAAGCDEGVAPDIAYSEILSFGGSALAVTYDKIIEALKPRTLSHTAYTVQQIDRDAACEYLKAFDRHVEAGIVVIGEHDSHAIVQLLVKQRVALAQCILTDSNIAAALQARMCCNGVECCCQGATVEQYLQYQLLEKE